ncbi:MAG: hypothetical protein ACR2QA_00030 [Solirubrobacteraceae bacterium]
MFSNTFAGTAPDSAPAFVIAQTVGGVLAWLAIRVLYPDVTPADAADVVLPHADVDHAHGNQLVVEGASR